MPDNNRTAGDIKREIEQERNELARSVESLRSEIKEATDVRAHLGRHLPIAAGVALGAGFLLAGGVGATVRLIFRRGREGTTKARFGPFVLVDRD
jgi:4-diphosphocytidyl-2C-methyl-D-erythritol kinase